MMKSVFRQFAITAMICSFLVAGFVGGRYVEKRSADHLEKWRQGIAASQVPATPAMMDAAYAPPVMIASQNVDNLVVSAPPQLAPDPISRIPEPSPMQMPQLPIGPPPIENKEVSPPDIVPTKAVEQFPAPNSPLMEPGATARPATLDELIDALAKALIDKAKVEESEQETRAELGKALERQEERLRSVGLTNTPASDKPINVVKTESVDDLIHRLTQFKVQRAAVDQQAKQHADTIRARLRDQQERLRKLDIAPPETVEPPSAPTKPLEE